MGRLSGWRGFAAAAGLGLAVAIGAGTGVARASAGTSWRLVHRYWESYSNQLEGVVALSARNAWAAGIGKAHSALVMHWNGSAWSRVTIPQAGSFYATSIEASGANNVWVSGNSNDGFGTAVIMRWNGSSWTNIDLPPGTAISAGAVVSPTDFWAASMSACGPRGGGCGAGPSPGWRGPLVAAMLPPHACCWSPGRSTGLVTACPWLLTNRSSCAVHCAVNKNWSTALSTIQDSHCSLP